MAGGVDILEVGICFYKIGVGVVLAPFVIVFSPIILPGLLIIWIGEKIEKNLKNEQNGT